MSVLLLFVVQLKNSASWVYTALEPGRFTSADEAWGKTGSRDYVAYAKFIRQKLLTRVDDQIAIHVPPNDLSDNQFVQRFKPKAPKIYLFPSSIEVLDSYEFVLTSHQKARLDRRLLLSETYGGNTFHVLSDVNADIHSEWAIFIFEQGNMTHVFTLPLDAQYWGRDF